MPASTFWRFLLVPICGACLGIRADAQPNAATEPSSNEINVDQVLAMIAAGETPSGDSEELVIELIRVLNQGDAHEAILAVRGLARIGPAAGPAIPALCAKLGSSDHAMRSVAVETLAAIGSDAVPQLRALLSSPSARTRAAAGDALNRLNALELADIDQFLQDPDARARAVAANALSRCGEAGVARLTPLLVDQELVVAIEAARSLQVNLNSPTLAIPALTAAVSRPFLGRFAAEALAKHGVAARRAIPAILKNYPLGKQDWFIWEDVAESAVKSIGPPDERDLPEIGELLAHEDIEIQILAADSLARMGPSGRSATPLLEAAVHTAVGRYLKLRGEAEAQQDEFYVDNSGRQRVAAEHLVAASWAVTRDPRQFIALLEWTSRNSHSAITFSTPTPWESFPKEELPLVRNMLESGEVSLQLTALDAVRRMGARAVPLADAVRKLASSPNEDVAHSAMDALDALEHTAGGGVQ